MISKRERRAIERVIWEAAIRVAADEADRDVIEHMTESQRKWHAKHMPAHRCALARRILELKEMTPPQSELLGA